MTSRNGDSQLLRPARDETNVHLDSMSGNQVFRFHDLQQWYATSVWDAKRDFLRNTLDVCGEPLVLYSLQKIFDRAYTAARDVAQYCNIGGDRSFDVRPFLQDNHESLLDVTALKTTTDDYTDWLGGLSKHGQLAVFIRLMLLGGIGIIATTCDHIDRLIRLNGNLPNLRNSIGKNTEMQNAILTIPDDLLLSQDALTDSEKILSTTNLDGNSSKIPDAVYRDYEERKNEWKNKLDAFEQKYRANRRTAEPDSSDLAQMLPVSNVILAAGKLLSDTAGKETKATLTSTNGNAEHLPLRSSHTLASVTEYKKARNYIDLQIDRLRLKIQKTRQTDNKTEQDDCKNVEPFNDYFFTEKADSTHTLKVESSELSNNELQTIDELSTEIGI